MSAIFIFVTGLILGAGFTVYFFTKWTDTYMKNQSFVGIADRYMVLKAIRGSQTDWAVDALELQMNGEIMKFAANEKDIPLSRLKPSDLRLIAKVKNYRIAHPYAEDPDVDRTVASILSLTNKTLWPNTALEPTPTALQP